MLPPLGREGLEESPADEEELEPPPRKGFRKSGKPLRPSLLEG